MFITLDNFVYSFYLYCLSAMINNCWGTLGKFTFMCVKFCVKNEVSYLHFPAAFGIVNDVLRNIKD